MAEVEPRLQQRRRPQRAVERGGGGPPPLPDRRERVPAQHERVPAARHPGSLRGHRRQSQGLRPHGPGPAQPRADRQAVGAPRVHRGGGRHRALQAAARRDPGQARRRPARTSQRVRDVMDEVRRQLALARAPGAEGAAVQGAPARSGRRSTWPSSRPTTRRSPRSTRRSRARWRRCARPRSSERAPDRQP